MNHSVMFYSATMAWSYQLLLLKPQHTCVCVMMSVLIQDYGRLVMNYGRVSRQGMLILKTWQLREEKIKQYSHQ